MSIAAAFGWRSARLISLLASIGFLLTAIGFANADDGADRYPWLTDLDAARALAAAEGKPLLVVFRCEP